MKDSTVLDAESDHPKVYSKFSIILMSILGSTFFASILYSINLGKIGEKKHIAGTIISGVISTTVGGALIKNYGIHSVWLYFLIHGIGGYILTGPFWKYHFEEKDYKTKFAWLPILIMLLIIVGLVVLYFGLQTRYYISDMYIDEAINQN
jgi:hypothetical protein